MGVFQGPRAAGTTLQLLYHAIGAGEAGFRASRFVRGGTGALSSALADVARQHGAQMVVSNAVRSIDLLDDQVAGVTLQDGDKLASRLVVSSVDPRQLYFDLIGAHNLPLQFVREVKNIKSRGSTARVNLALDGLPEISGVGGNPERLAGHLLMCPNDVNHASLEALERAFDAAKYGEYSPQPCLDMVIPTLSDPALAPQGKHILSIDVRYMPYNLRTGSWDEHRERLADVVLQVLSGYAPGIQQKIVHRQILTPLDYECMYSLPKGDSYHGEMGLDQMLFMRPVAGSQGSLSPIPGLYLCGAGAHPGGGVTGAPGYIASRQVLKKYRSEH
jgi:phytoene dehydrogenase-like protein